MSVTDLIGAEMPTQTVRVERGPVSFFAHAVTDDDPVFHDARAAAQAGFDAVPAPPTFSFAMSHMGALPELQGEGADRESPLTQAISRLMADGGLILHGEQAFTYHRTVQVDDVLTSHGRLADVQVKESSSGKVMTTMTVETEWRDADDRPVVTTTMTILHRR